MAEKLSAGGVAEQALRLIGAFTANDSAADPAEYEVAISALDMLVAELTGRHKFWWLVPATQTVALTAGKATYSLAALLEPKLEFYERAYLVRSGLDSPLDLVRRSVYDEIADKTQTGTPGMVYVERADNPTAYVAPVPGSSGLSLKLVGQRYAPDIAAERGAAPHLFPASWQRYLSHALAADIGNGPVRTLTKSRRDDFREVAKTAFAGLAAFSSREQIDRARFVSHNPF